MLSQTATDVAILDADNCVQAWLCAGNQTQAIDWKDFRQAGTFYVLLIADVSLASVSGSKLTAETKKTISNKNKKAPCEVRR
ncbi:hypothetical protein [Pseudomonas putida]|uniref:hypothetical protein n=1 Tax=Pseudomonas putida TaxID=303 RepID=UPI003D958927